LFENAISADAGSAEAYLGLGYAYYSLRQYRDSLLAWEEGARLEPSNSIVFISLGTLYWRIATLGDDYNTTGGDRCSSDALADAEKSRSAKQLEMSLENLRHSTELAGQEPEDVAFTFRTMAQVQYLLRNCPGYDSVEVLKTAVGYYQEALRLDPDNAAYWHIKARLSYTVWLQSPPGTGPSAREWLFAGLRDNDRALALEPADRGDYRPNAWRATILKEAVDGTMAQGDRRFANGDYLLALAYYELVANNQTDNATAAFRAGLAALAGREPEKALDWYQQGFERAVASRDESSIENAGVELKAFRANRSRIELGEIEALFSEKGIDLNSP
jgi:tetratricopeptide (TPR) repeat protein